ncbi:hypothetical protein WICPIJ_006341 [Wickerhamomyces pijperi]|uniref:Uncharacterized protein n=1 Tax=Wickerhamomyces pijperi TaxID=599730 RepID=A0A9P8Q1U2_WICPI|nr:hypothetical protein WICPIJ_006341 [Wickerhamomyces pijperi]
MASTNDDTVAMTITDQPSVNLISAGILSPTPKCTKSPGTNCVASVTCVEPFLIKWASAGTNLFKACKDCSDLYSWTNPTVTTIRMAMVMETASSMLPMSPEITAEPISRRINGSE